MLLKTAHRLTEDQCIDLQSHMILMCNHIKRFNEERDEESLELICDMAYQFLNQGTVGFLEKSEFFVKTYKED